MRIMVMGAPGSGKGTLAKQLSADYGIPHISTGDMLRNEMADGTDIGIEIKSLMAEGKLVPDMMALQLVMQRIGMADCGDGFILDGYPRNESQAEYFDEILAKDGKPLDRVLQIEVEYDTIIKRLTGRRNCSWCNAIFNIYTFAPKIEGICDKCNHILIQREDDNESVINRRLDVYVNETQLLIRYYGYKGVMRLISGEGGISEVYDKAKKILDKVKK